MCDLSDKKSELFWLIIPIFLFAPTLLYAESKVSSLPLVFAITPKAAVFNESRAVSQLVEEDVVLNSEQFFNANGTFPEEAPAEAFVLKNYYSPHTSAQINWNTLNLDAPPTPEELKHARRSIKMLFPILSLGALAKYVFSGEPIDASGHSYSEDYDSFLVLGGSNHLADGMAELLEEFGLNVIDARSASLIIMLVPAQSRAIYNDLKLNTKKLTFAEALNHSAFKSTSNQANHVVTQLALPYIKERMDTKKYPGLEKMLAGAMSSASLAALPVLFQIVWGLTHGGDTAFGKMAVDSGVGFLYSTAVTSFKGVNQQAAHVYLDGAKGSQWCNPELRDCEKVDDNGVYSELMAGALCYLGAGMVDLAESMLPAPISPKAIPVTGGLIPWLKWWVVNNGAKVANNAVKVSSKVMKTTSGHLRKVTAYAGSDAFNKKMKYELSSYTSEAEAGSSALTFITNIGLSFLSSKHNNGKPYKTGFGLKSINAYYNLGAIATVKLFYYFGLNHAFGLSRPLDAPRDYYTQHRGTALVYPNLEEGLHGYTPMQIVHPDKLDISFK